MEGIYIIDDKKHAFIQNLSYPKIEISEIKQDYELHDFVQRIFKVYPDIQKLIIPIHVGNSGFQYRGLHLGMHLRLSNEINGKRFIPLVFIGNDDLEEIILDTRRNNLNLGYLLLTEGVTLISDKNIEEIIAEAKAIQGLNSSNFRKEFLEKITIQSELSGGRSDKHSLANQWGAFRLDEVAGTQALKGKALLNKQKNLYFKYIRSQHFNYDNIDLAISQAQNTINCAAKNILLIDDEANEGWDLVLPKILEESNFSIIKQDGKSFEDFYQEANNEIINNDWDLILLDLRLNPENEESSTFIAKGDISAYSGAKLLKKIKEKNKGTQVIIMTASNKAWNMKYLLELGADGYYVKESPDIAFSSDFSHSNYQNFKTEVESCLNKKYLSTCFTTISNLKIHLDTKSATYTNNEIPEIKAQLEIAYSLLYTAKDDVSFSYAYISLFRILEIMSEKFTHAASFTYDSTKNLTWNKWEITSNSLIIFKRENSVFQRIISIAKDWLNVAIDYERLHWAVQRRNNFIHPDKIVANQTEIDKIKTAEGFLEVLDIIKHIIKAL